MLNFSVMLPVSVEIPERSGGVEELKIFVPSESAAVVCTDAAKARQWH